MTQPQRDPRTSNNSGPAPHNQVGAGFNPGGQPGYPAAPHSRQNPYAPYGYPAPYPVRKRPSTPLKRVGIVGLAVGGALLVLTVLIMVMPYGLFILGGGGDTQEFNKMADGFFTAGCVVGVPGLAALVLGIIAISKASSAPRQ